MEIVADYADDAAEQALREHLASCGACAELLRSEGAFLERLRGATDIAMPEEAKARLRRLLASVRD
jgi:hypothetical protein